MLIPFMKDNKVIKIINHSPAIANPFLLYSLLSKVFSIKSATSARVILLVVPVLHCPSSTL